MHKRQGKETRPIYILTQDHPRMVTTTCKFKKSPNSNCNPPPRDSARKHARPLILHTRRRRENGRIRE